MSRGWHGKRADGAAAQVWEQSDGWYLGVWNTARGGRADSFTVFAAIDRAVTAATAQGFVGAEVEA